MKSILFLVVGAAVLALILPTAIQPVTTAEAGGADPFLGEMTMFGGTFAPRGWAFCDGQLLAISQNDALFSLLGTIYGGDGRTTFGLPDCRGNVLIHQGTGPGLSNYRIGEKSGTEQVTVNTGNLPSHNHPGGLVFKLKATTTAGLPPDYTNTPTEDSIFARSAARIYSAGGGTIIEHNESIIGETTTQTDSEGGSQPFDNRQPSIAINRIIALEGIYPSRN